MRLILASASPRRAELLRSAGFAFDIAPAEIEETPGSDEPAGHYTLRVAREKARQVATLPTSADAAVLAADTEVVVNGQILGKPADDEKAAGMLRTLSGLAHDVLTAVVVRHRGREVTDVVTTRVYFAPLSPQEIAWYVASGEPMGKAGAYAIQGLGARFIDRIEGSWSSVVGLPIATVHRLLREVQ